MIQLVNGGKKFGKRWILKNIHLSVSPQDSIVILGLSGSGKSTLLKIIAGLLFFDEGEIKRNIKRIGMCFQNNALFDSMSVEENLLFPLLQKKKPLDKAFALLKEMGLYESRLKYPHEISGGMQKRLAVARVLVIEPELILIDEPTAGLDPVTSLAILKSILAFQKEQTIPMITVTTNVKTAYEMGSRIFLLHDSRLIEAGSPQAFINSTNPDIQQFRQGAFSDPMGFSP